MCSTEEILSNVVWLVNALDEEGLSAVQDVPFIEMAKSVSISSATNTSGEIDKMESM